MPKSPLSVPLYDVFLSHNSKDKAAVRYLKQRLEGDGLSVWFDERELLAGTELHKEIAVGLNRSRVCVVFIGTEGFGPWHDWEIGLAVNMHVNSSDFRLIPVILPREHKSKFLASQVPLWLRGLLWVEFTSIYDDESYLRLKDGILGRGAEFTPRALQNITEETESNIVPCGLLAFDERARHFYLRLVAGPRDHCGLPNSIAFWKSHFEQVDPARTFRVGLLFGPSGCGKSSLVQAGLLPRLHQYVKTIYIAASADCTESNLLSELHKLFQELPPELELAEALAYLASHPEALGKFKLVIVLDQFEQWLHSNIAMAETPLIAALRNCDAANVQALVMVRSDFYLETHRFFEQLIGVKIQTEVNTYLVDLFERPHARHVLLEYGRAHGRFKDPLALSADEERFLDRTLDQLQDKDQRLAAVQLALFADLMKNKPWTGTVLRKLGGATGVGRAFLEEKFDSRTANATHRFFRQAAIAVLKELLPPNGAGIKGTSKTDLELVRATGLANRLQDFRRLLEVLLNDLKLISPVAMEEGLQGSEPSYQLSHDYLVPSLRDWLVAKDRETWRGRARLLLEERTSAWLRDAKHPRHLPTMLQWLHIQLGVPRRLRSELSSHLLRKTIRRYMARAVLSVGVVLSPVAIYLGKEFCTFKAVFEVAHEPAMREVVIVRCFDPRPSEWRFRLGTFIFMDEHEDEDAFNKLNGGFVLNFGLAPDWNMLAPLLKFDRFRLAQFEWLGGKVSGGWSNWDLDDSKAYCRAAPHMVIDSLMKSLDNERERQRAVTLLVSMGNQQPKIVKSLLSMLNDQYDREAAAKLCGHLQSQEPIIHDALMALIEDREQPNSLRFYALESLLKMGESNEYLVRKLVVFLNVPNLHYEAQKLLWQLVKAGIPVSIAIADLLNEPHISDQAFRTIETLDYADERIIEALVAITTNPQRAHKTRVSAAQAICKLRSTDSRVIAALVDLLKTGDPWDQWSVVNLLGEYSSGERNVIETLTVSLIRAEDAGGYCAISEALARLGRSDLIDFEKLTRLLEREDSDYSTTASLIEIACHDDIVPKILLRLLEQNKIVRERYTVVRSLPAIEADHAALTDSLVSMLDVENGDELWMAAAALLEMKKEEVRAAEVLYSLLHTEKNSVCYDAAFFLAKYGKSNEQIIEVLCKRLGFTDGNPNYIVPVLRPLISKDSTVIPTLTRLLGADAVEIPRGAAMALAHLGTDDKAVAKVLSSTLKDHQAARSSFIELAKTHKGAVTHLCQTLQSGDVALRTKAADILAEITSSDAHVCESIAALLIDKEWTVRAHAAEAIGKISQHVTEWTDKQMLRDLASHDSLIRERAGIVLAYRRQKINSELTADEHSHMLDLRQQIQQLRQDSRPWVRQAAFHALCRIEKRYDELEDEAQYRAQLAPEQPR